MRSLPLGGYTLFEAMLALTIIAVLSAISVPSFRSFININNDRILQSELVGTLQLARQEASMRDVPISICKSKNRATCGGEWTDGLLVFADEQDDGIVHDRQQIIAITQINTHGGKINWRAYPYYRDHLRFVPRKLISADNGMFWYCRSTNDMPVFAVVVSKLGSGHVVLPNESGEIKDSRGRALRC